MDITESKLITGKTARYFTLGHAGEHIKNVWFVLHGYGQLANYFLKKFEVLAAADTLVVAPEGLHRFYTRGAAGRVGASWMTAEDRLTDINDYINYLDQLYHTIISQLTTSVKINVLGFSQGAATASRWLCHGRSKAHIIILWAGLIPPDLDLYLAKSVFNDAKLLLVIGDQDEFIDKHQLEKQQTILKDNGIRSEIIGFNGTHVMSDQILVGLAMQHIM